ncbi:MAG: ABC transporter ATP-binding protein [Minisyncoccales bacterium]|jgi:NitT/TauT family transport system ATP-binding protein
MIEFKNVTKKFESLLVLDEINFSIEKGSFVSIVGPSGCGKTTTLRMIAGLSNPTSGDILICQKSPKEMLKERSFGFVFQDSTLLEWRNVRDNIALPLEIFGKVNNERVQKFINIVGLNGFENYYPNQLSGGMQQRVAIARALILEPPILLMDEPFGSLDEITRNQMNSELMRIWNDDSMSSTTIVFVTHSISEAVFLSDKVLVMSQIPAKIKEKIEINIERPRIEEIKSSKEYLGKVTRLKNLLSEDLHELQI